MIHTSLKDYYSLISALKINNYTVPEIEAMIPFERDLYSEMLTSHLETRRAE